jgi:general secretion pathway protein N
MEAGSINKRRYILIGVILYLILLIAYAPASLIPWLLDKSGVSEISLHNTNGSLWNGSGQLVSMAGKNKAYQITQVNWNISATSLLLGRLKAAISFSDDALMGKTTLTVKPGGLLIENMKLGLPASTVAHIYKPAALLNPSGNITINSKMLEISKDSISGKARAQWHDAGSRMSSVNPLGSYELNIASNKKGDKASINIRTLSGSLSATASGSWDIAKSDMLVLNGQIKPTSNTAELEPLLRFLGRDLGGGKRALRINTKVSI